MALLHAVSQGHGALLDGSGLNGASLRTWAISAAAHAATSTVAANQPRAFCEWRSVVIGTLRSCMGSPIVRTFPLRHGIALLTF